MLELTRAEEQIMQILWDIEKGFVKDILERIPEPKPAYNTVSTIVRILETKAFIAHKAYGKTHEYFPLVSKEQYKNHLAKNFLNNYFDGSPKEMVSYFINEKNISISDMEEILKLIQKK